MKKIILLGFLPLLLGLLLYVLFSPFNPLQRFFGLPEGIIYNQRIPRCVYQQIPDLLWAFSLTNLLLVLAAPRQFRDLLFILGLSVVITFSFEILQLLKVYPGTFDYVDLSMYLAGTIPALLEFKKANKGEIELS
jgi:hypothetical protein